jgi:hypothetical protein
MIMIAEHVAEWTRRQREQYRICETLSRTGDRLPIYDIDACRSAATTIRLTLTEIHSYEEEKLFPVLRTMSPQIAPLVESFVAHHAHDRIHAERISLELEALSHGDAVDINWLKERIGLFAEGLRRHVQFEETICKALFASRRAAAEQAVQ